MNVIPKEKRLVLWFDEVSKEDTLLVGGKCANLGEMGKAGVPVPEGYAVTAYAYRYFIEKTGIKERILKLLEGLDVNDLGVLHEITARIRQIMETVEIPRELAEKISAHYNQLSEKLGVPEALVAVRSSATAEDLPGASFAGQQETYLNIKGRDELLRHVKRCFASLFTPRATAYREDKGFKHDQVYLSVGVQRMVNSLASGVMFSLHPVTGDRSVLVIEAAWGLGEFVVQGKVNPDEFTVRKSNLEIIDRKVGVKKTMLKLLPQGGTREEAVTPELQNKPCLEDEQVRKLAAYAIKLEEHYKLAQDMEWALDADENKIYMMQSRPETVWTEKAREDTFKVKEETRKLKKKVELTKERKPLVTGLPAAPGIAAGRVQVVMDVEKVAEFKDGEIVVTGMTTPDWVPVMRKAGAIVTDAGGMTCHAAIVSRELGVPCIVGTGDATSVLKTGQTVTVDATHGVVYEGILEEAVKPEVMLEAVPLPERRVAPPVLVPPTLPPPELAPVTGTKVYVNLGIPEKAEEVSRLPVDGVGLMRVEFIIATYVGEHPLRLVEQGTPEKFVNKLAEGVARVAKAFSPRVVVLRLSDFKTNEYRELKGGERYEVVEDNPMLGWRGASRYIDPTYEPAFRLELKVVKKVREEMGLKNLYVMIPFVRTPNELKRVLDYMREEGLERGPDFHVWMMCEVPSNVILADRFAPLVDGFSIGSNDLTQLILAVDRDSEKLAYIFDERDEAVLRAVKHFIRVAHEHGCTVSICGQAPSVYPDFTKFLIENGIDSISVNPDVAVQTIRLVAQIEQRISLEAALGIKKTPSKVEFKPEW